MKLLLDTHVVLWWLSDPDALSEEASSCIADSDHVVYLSAAVVWEIRIKEALKKLSIPRTFEAVLAAEFFEELPIRVAHAHLLRRLPFVHRDPFDRMLVAQALGEEATLVTRDPVFAEYGVPVLQA